MRPQSRKVLCFGDIYKHLEALLESVAEFKVFSAQSKKMLESAPQLSAACNCAEGVEAAATQLVDLHLDPRCVRCCDKRSRRRKTEGCSALARAYLKYKVIEALQPLPAYDNDDGFQPLLIIRSLKFDGDRKGREALAEFRGRELPIMAIVDELVQEGTIVKTSYEPHNGDVMLGLPEYLPRRKAAHEERKTIVADLALKYRHIAGWNEDGTGWLTPPRRDYAEIRGSVWDLLSYLHAIDHVAGESPRSFH
jgi:hypothetical protein